MNRKKNYRDVEKCKETCKKQNRRYYAKTAFAKNHKKEWTEQEEELVTRHEITDTELSALIGRSVKAIQVRRYVINRRKK